jgi:hypothetical protein
LPPWEWVVDVIGLLVVLAILVVVALIVRRRTLARGGGTFDLSINRRPQTGVRSGRGWTLGIGRYTGERLEWYRVFSLNPRPSVVLERGHVQVSGRRDPEGPEVFALYAGNVIADCRTDRMRMQLGLSPESLTGLLAWLESGPPGRGSGKVI